MSKITLTKLGRMRKLNKAKAVFVRLRMLGKRVPTNVAGYTPPQPRTEKLVAIPGRLKQRLQVFLSPGEACNVRRRYRKEIERRNKAVTIGA